MIEGEAPEEADAAVRTRVEVIEQRRSRLTQSQQRRPQDPPPQVWPRPLRAGEITVTRRLFRTGDSEYLLNGKICRLRDIQDIFMGTGLGGESYAIIGQERIGQLSAPSRSIAAPSSKRPPASPASRPKSASPSSASSPPSRTSPASTTSSRRSPSQMVTLKRQAAKAERYGALRDELRTTPPRRPRQPHHTARRREAASRRRDRPPQRRHRHSGRRHRGHGRRAHRGRPSAATRSTADPRGRHRQPVRRRARAHHRPLRLQRRPHQRAHQPHRRRRRRARSSARAQLAQLAGEQKKHRSFLESATSESTAPARPPQASRPRPTTPSAPYHRRAGARAEPPRLHAAHAARRTDAQ